MIDRSRNRLVILIKGNNNKSKRLQFFVTRNAVSTGNLKAKAADEGTFLGQNIKAWCGVLVYWFNAFSKNLIDDHDPIHHTKCQLTGQVFKLTNINCSKLILYFLWIIQLQLMYTKCIFFHPMSTQNQNSTFSLFLSKKLNYFHF